MAPKINIVVRLQHWMDSVPGQTFLNYAYSWGASVVILGALFKLTHLPGGNLMLFIGMGTEVVVFFLSAFDRPFDKSEAGKELPADYETDEEIARRLGLTDDEEEPGADAGEELAHPEIAGQPARPAAPAASGAKSHPQGGVGGTTVIISGAGIPASNAGNPTPNVENPTPNVNESTPNVETSTSNAGIAATGAAAPAPQAGGVSIPAHPQDMDAEKLASIIRMANDELLRRAQAVLSPEMEEATQTYIEKLQTLTETLAKVDEQSSKLTRDSEEMENLNRTLTGINKVYELHLKGISSQVGTIDQVNEQTRRLAAQIEELNGVYGRMIKALTVNMKNAAASAAE